MPSFKNPITNQVIDIRELEDGTLKLGNYPLMPVNASERRISITGATHVISVDKDTKWYCHLRGQNGTFFVSEKVDKLSHEINVSADLNVVVFNHGKIGIRYNQKDGSLGPIVHDQKPEDMSALINEHYKDHTTVVEESLINNKYDTKNNKNVGGGNIYHLACAFDLDVEINIEKRGDKFFLYVGRETNDTELMPIKEDIKKRSKTGANYQVAMRRNEKNQQVIITLLHMDWDAKMFWRAEYLPEIKIEDETEAKHVVFTDNKTITFYKENDKTTIKSGLAPNEADSNPESPISKEDVDELIKKTKQTYKEIVDQKTPKVTHEEVSSGIKGFVAKVSESMSTNKKSKNPK